MTKAHFPFIDLESDMISAFMLDRKFWVDMFEHIDPEYFNNRRIAKSFGILKAFYSKYHNFPTEKQAKQLAKLRYDTETVQQVEKIYARNDLQKQEVDYLRDETKHFIKNAKLEMAVLEAAELIETKKNVKDDQERKDLDYEIEDKVKVATSWNHEVKLGLEIQEVDKRYDIVDDIYATAIETPFQALNAYIHGYFKKELFLYISASSVGKSIALQQSANYAWDILNKNVAFVTLELSEERSGVRMDVSGSGIPVGELLRNREKIKQYYKARQHNNRMFIKEFPTSSIHCGSIQQYLYQLELYEEFIPDILFVDYGDILLPKRTGYSLYENAGGTFEELRGLAQVYEIPVVSASQFNRSAISLTSEELDESKIADSWRKMTIADTLIALISTPEMRLKNRMDMKILKNRSGEKNTILPFDVFYELLRINDIKINGGQQP